HIKRVLIIFEVRHGSVFHLRELRDTARDPVCQWVTGTGGAPVFYRCSTLGRIIQPTPGLVVAGKVPIEAGLERMASRHLGDVVADIRRLGQFTERTLATGRPWCAVRIGRKA